MSFLQKDPSSILPYRPCVGIMLVNRENKVFIAKRVGLDTQAWQMPQGGIDPEESPETAAFRELKEEIGTCNARKIAESQAWHSYDFPPAFQMKDLRDRFQGQIQRWFLMRFLGKDSEINLTAYEQVEFSEWRWAEVKELPDLIIYFKRESYLKIIQELYPLALEDTRLAQLHKEE